MTDNLPTIAVLGAAGLIGESIAQAVRREGFPLLAIARRFTDAQAAALEGCALTTPIVGQTPTDLARVFRENDVDIVVNCIGVLQDSVRGTTADAHEAFVRRLVEALKESGRDRLLVHLSIPGRDEDDGTAFSRTKREGERLIAASGLPFAILRPGFVIAPRAFGGSALFRALAAAPLAVPDSVGATAFAPIHVDDISRTIAVLARRWAAGERAVSATWELVAREPSTVGGVIDAFRRHLGGPKPLVRVPLWMLTLGAAAGDAVAHLGWAPPVRSTALVEMRRGVTGDPAPWIAATGIEPRSLSDAVASQPATVQERWFARLFLLKPAIVGMLAVFWIASGLIALTVAFRPAAAIFTSHGYPAWLANALTVVSSLMDISVGAAIAFSRTHRAGLLAGIALSLFYMASATVVTPELWIEPLGALVKTGPAIVLMAVAFAIADDR